MTDALRRTIRRCTALLLIVLGAIAVEAASLEYPDGGNLVGGGAILAGVVYLVASGFAALAEKADRDGTATGGTDDDGSDGGDGPDDDGADSGAGDEEPVTAPMPPFGD